MQDLLENMVGFTPGAERHLSDAQLGAAGAVSGAVTRAICQPLDVLKIRFQLQLEPVTSESHVSKYRGVLQATRVIIFEEGLRALWKGHVPAQGISIVYGAVQFSTFEALTRKASSLSLDVTSPVVHFMCGSGAGIFASLSSHPLDVIRTRLVAQGEPKVYRGMGHAVVCLVHQEGFFSLYRGLTPSLILISPQIGAMFAFYRAFTELLRSKLPSSETWSPLLCGALAGVCSKTLVYPLDLAKKRLQVTGFENARKAFGEVVAFRGLGHVLQRAVVKEGPRGLFKGLWPSVIKAAATTGLQLAVYEHTCRLLLACS